MPKWNKYNWNIISTDHLPNNLFNFSYFPLLLRSHLQDLKEVTHNIHYETYRAKRLNDNGGLHPISSNDTNL